MSKRQTNTTNRRYNASVQAEFNHGMQMIFPGLVVAIIAFFVIVNWIAAPTSPVHASTAEEVSPAQTQASTRQVEPVVMQPGNGQEQSTANQTAAQQASQACTIGARYPDSIRQWCGLIENAAAKYGLEPNLLAAVMLQESGGDPQAYSSSGAVGLMQVMPRDGIAAGFLCQNGPCFANRPTMDELFDPAFNVDYGARMLSALIQRTGSVRDGLLAYGPMDVGYYYADLVLTILKNYR